MATLTQYNFTQQVDYPNVLVSNIQASSISIALDHIDTLGSGAGMIVSVWFKDILPTADQDTLNSVMAAYKNVAPIVPIVQTDTDNALFARTKVVPTGMTFCLRAFEVATSTLNSLINNDYTGTPMSDISITFYDANGIVLTSDLSTCVKTVIDFEPTFDYYIIGGQIRIYLTPTQDVRVHVIGVPDVPANFGGSKIMVQNVNLKYISASDKIETDGRAGKPLSYSATNHTNKIRFILYHPAAYVQPLLIAIELFK